MKRFKNIKLFFLVILFFNNSYASQYPMQIYPFHKNEANYITPENTFIAKISSLLDHDILWYYETLTYESAEKDKNLFQEAGIDPERNFDLIDEDDEFLILDKKQYKNGIMLLIETQKTDGRILIGPTVLVQENGLWKTTTEFAGDQELLDCLIVIPPLFDGKGQKPADTNSFLSYEKPQQVKTELEPGQDSYLLHIYYGRTIDPKTFSAVLNKTDISGNFSPEPFTDQEVRIPLDQGKNVLKLSVQGTKKNGKKAKDKDQLVFIVP